jgi:hypothetical protein
MNTEPDNYNEMSTAELDEAYLEVLDQLAIMPVSTAELRGETPISL